MKSLLDFSTKFDNRLFPTDKKRLLPATLQPYSPTSTKVPVNDMMKEDFHPKRLIQPSLVPGIPSSMRRRPNTSDFRMEKNSSRASNDMMNDNDHAVRILPPSLMSDIQSDLYRSGGVVDEQAAGDERLIYQTALQV